jgi:hypothetical protein
MIFLLWIGIGLVIVYEIWSMVNKAPEDTISQMVWRATTKRPVVPFLFGLLMGHFFWRW